MLAAPTRWRGSLQHRCRNLDTGSVAGSSVEVSHEQPHILDEPDPLGDVSATTKKDAPRETVEPEVLGNTHQQDWALQ